MISSRRLSSTHIRLLHLQNTTNKMQLFSVYFVHKTLYMFWVVSPPIIRSTKLYIQRQAFVRPLLLPAAIADEMNISSTIAASSSIG
jgi:hypothetical protein